MQENPYHPPSSSETVAPSQPQKKQPSALTFRGIFPAAAVIWTVTAISAEAVDAGGFALGIALFYGPAGSLLLALLGGAYLALRPRSGPRSSRGPDIMLLVICTLASMLAIFFAVSGMNLHGC